MAFKTYETVFPSDPFNEDSNDDDIPLVIRTLRLDDGIVQRGFSG